MTNLTGMTKTLIGMMTSDKKDFTKTIVLATAIATMKDHVAHADHKNKEDVAVSTSSDVANISIKNGSQI